jgi:hypothetical protein
MSEALSLGDVGKIVAHLKNIVSFFRGTGATFDVAWTSFQDIIAMVMSFLSGATPAPEGILVPVIPVPLAEDLEGQIDHAIKHLEHPDVQQLGLGIGGIIAMLLPILKPLLSAMLQKFLDRIGQK